MTQTTGAQQLNLLQQNLFYVTIEPKLIDETSEGLERQIIQFWTKKVPFAGRSIDSVIIPNTIQDIPVPVGRQKFNDITLTFLLDERLEGYISLVRWMSRNSPFKQLNNDFPIDFDRKESVREWVKRSRSVGEKTKEWVPREYRDIYITLKDLSNVSYGYLVYYEAFPVMISDFEFDTTSSENVELTVNFKYLYSDILDINREAVCR